MRLLACFRKTWAENLREWKILVLALAFGPFFVYLMHAYFGAASPSYALRVVNRDQPARSPDGAVLAAGADLLAAWRALAYPDGKPVFQVRLAVDPAAARRELRERSADLLLVIPAEFSRRLAEHAGGRRGPWAQLVSWGDPGNARFTVAASFADYVAFSRVSALTGGQTPLSIDFRSVSAGRRLGEFDLYVPALLVLAIIMVMFTAAASFIKEVDRKTITRLALSRLTTAEFVAAVSLNQVLIGCAALGLTFLAALHTGYRSDGSLALFFLVGALSCLSVIAISLLVAAFLRTIFELLTVGVFPFFVLMFFSESMFPLPRITLLRLGGHVYYANDLLPTSLTVKAFHKILNAGAGLGDLGYELAGMALLTLLLFAAGAWLYRRRHLPPLSRAGR